MINFKDIISTSFLLASVLLGAHAQMPSAIPTQAHGKSTQAKRVDYQEEIIENYARIKQANKDLNLLLEIATLIVEFKPLEKSSKTPKQKISLTPCVSDLIKNLQGVIAIYYDDKKNTMIAETKTDKLLCGLIPRKNKLKLVTISTQSNEEASNCFEVSYAMCAILEDEINRLTHEAKEAITRIKINQAKLNNTSELVRKFTPGPTHRGLNEKNDNKASYLEEDFIEITTKLKRPLQLMRDFTRTLEDNSTL